MDLRSAVAPYPNSAPANSRDNWYLKLACSSLKLKLSLRSVLLRDNNGRQSLIVQHFLVLANRMPIALDLHDGFVV